MFRIISRIYRSGEAKRRLRLVKGNIETRLSYPDIFWFQAAVKDNSLLRELVSPIFFLPLPLHILPPCIYFSAFFLWYPILEASSNAKKKKRKEKEEVCKEYKSFTRLSPSPLDIGFITAYPKISFDALRARISKIGYFFFEREAN